MAPDKAPAPNRRPRSGRGFLPTSDWLTGAPTSKSAYAARSYPTDERTVKPLGIGPCGLLDDLSRRGRQRSSRGFLPTSDWLTGAPTSESAYAARSYPTDERTVKPLGIGPCGLLDGLSRRGRQRSSRGLPPTSDWLTGAPTSKSAYAAPKTRLTSGRLSPSGADHAGCRTI